MAACIFIIGDNSAFSLSLSLQASGRELASGNCSEASFSHGMKNTGSSPDWIHVLPPLEFTMTQQPHRGPGLPSLSFRVGGSDSLVQDGGKVFDQGNLTWTVLRLVASAVLWDSFVILIWKALEQAVATRRGGADNCLRVHLCRCVSERQRKCQHFITSSINTSSSASAFFVDSFLWGPLMCVSNIYEDVDPAAGSSSHCTRCTVMMKLVHNKPSHVLLALSFVGVFSASSVAYQSLAALTVALSNFWR